MEVWLMTGSECCQDCPAALCDPCDDGGGGDHPLFNCGTFWSPAFPGDQTCVEWGTEEAPTSPTGLSDCDSAWCLNDGLGGPVFPSIIVQSHEPESIPGSVGRFAIYGGVSAGGCSIRVIAVVSGTPSASFTVDGIAVGSGITIVLAQYEIAWVEWSVGPLSDHEDPDPDDAWFIAIQRCDCDPGDTC